MGTDVVYNTVTIRNCVTREFDQEIMYDASGTDLIGVRYKLGFEGWIHSQQALTTDNHGIQAANVPMGDTLNTQFDTVSQRLAVSRRPFVLKWNNKVVLQAHSPTPVQNNEATDPNMDIDNGPKPRGLTVLQVTPAAIKVRWSVEFCLSGCPSNSQSNLRIGPYRIINNRWSISETRDHDFFTTRRISGTVRFSDGLSAKHAFIAAMTPGLELGFRRESVEYEAHPNGLEMSYAIVDRQVHYAAPNPATSMQVTHSYSTNDGYTWLDECSVTLAGAPASERRALLSRMMQIVDARMEGLRTVRETDAQYLLESVVITEHFGEANSVNCNIVTKHLGEQTKLILGNILQNKLGRPLELAPLSGVPYDRRKSVKPSRHGYDPHGGARTPAFLFLLTCYYQDPCGTTKHIFGGTQPPPTEESESEKSSNPYPTQVESLNLPSGSDEKLSVGHKTAIYTMAKMSSRYVVDRMRVMLPLGAPATNGDTAEFADLAAGQALRVIYYDAERVGAWPGIPAMKDEYADGQIKGKLLKYTLEPMPPVLSPDSQKKVFRVLARACYGLNRIPTGNLAVGVLPYTSFRPADTRFPLQTVQSTEIGP